MRPRQRRSTARMVSLATMLALLFGLTGTALAQETRYVANGGEDIGDCTMEVAPCATIQHAVNESGPGDTIQVEAGEYPGNVTIDETVNLVGAQAGVDPRDGRVGPKTEVDGRLLVEAPDVSIDGFTITGDASYGVQIHDESGTMVTNTILAGNVVGVGTSPGDWDVSDVTVTRNLFEANTINGVTLHSLAGSGYVVTDNAFVDNGGNGIAINGEDGPVEDVTLSGNTSVGSETFLALIGGAGGVTDVTVSENEVTGTSQSAIFVGGSVDGVAITSNHVAGSDTAVNVMDVFGDANTGVAIEGNTFDGNGTAVGITSTGVAHEVRLDANTYTGNGTDLSRNPADHPIDIDAPQNTAPPEISGEAMVDEILTATAGEWTSEFGLDFGLQWLVDDEAVNGATGASYTVGEGDLGSTIRVAVTATDVEGQTATAQSSATATVQPQPTDPPSDTPPAPSEDELTSGNEDADASIENAAGGPIGPGDMIEVELSGFQPFEWVFLRLYSDPVDLGWFQADGNGDLTAEFRLPAGILTGEHKLVATGAEGTLIWASFVVVAQPLAFDDVPTDHLFRGDIDWLSANGITRGCNPPNNSLFCPDDPVTRGQMAAFLVRALQLPAASDQGFTDTSDSVFDEDIDALAAVDITRGCNPPENDEFCPDEELTRGEMAAFLVRALDLSPAGDQGFTDTSDSVFDEDIDALAAVDITRGCNPPENDEFCPDRSLTRAEMAAFLHRALSS